MLFVSKDARRSHMASAGVGAAIQDWVQGEKVAKAKKTVFGLVFAVGGVGFVGCAWDAKVPGLWQGLFIVTLMFMFLSSRSRKEVDGWFGG